MPEKSWQGVRNALREGNSCPHRNMLLDTYKGSEDCLFLNVYTRHLPNRDRQVLAKINRKLYYEIIQNYSIF